MVRGTKQHHWTWPPLTEPCPFPHCHLLLALSLSCHGFLVGGGDGPPMSDIFMEIVGVGW